jgi:hypothetical protein
MSVELLALPGLCRTGTDFSKMFFFCTDVFHLLKLEGDVFLLSRSFSSFAIKIATSNVDGVRTLDSSNMVYGAYDVQCRLVLATPPCISNP